MRTIVIGSGGRECAIVRALSFSPSVTEIHCVPGNSAIEKYALCHNFSLTEPEDLIDFIKQTDIQLAIIGPEDPLANGLSDQLREAGILTFGPSQAAAQLEASKIFCKKFLDSAQISTGQYQVVESFEEIVDATESSAGPWVLKVDGLAAGKGVFICSDKNELIEAAQKVFRDNAFGEAGKKALLEEFLQGWELSYFVLTDGTKFEPLPLAQDHKRLQDGDKGPNTGGMGAVAPLQISKNLNKEIRETIVAPFIQELQKQKFDYRGVIYFGIMVTPEGPKVLEINVRFGDPEAQVLLPLLDGDWGEVFYAIARGKCPQLTWRHIYIASVVMASGGYPLKYNKGSLIDGDVFFETNSSYFIQAAVAQNNQRDFVTNGGRVLNAIGIGGTAQEAVDKAYGQVQRVRWPGAHYRKDIGQKVLDKNGEVFKA